MSETTPKIFPYYILRFLPNLVRDEWVNVGVVLLDPNTGAFSEQLIEQEGEFARVKRLHPDADLELLRALPGQFARTHSELGLPAGAFLEKLGSTLSNAIQFSPRKAVETEDAASELDRLYATHVAPPRSDGRSTLFENTRVWIRDHLNRIFRSHSILTRMQRRVPVEEFTHPGDPLRLDFAYRFNGTRGFLQSVSLARDPAQAKVLAYTARSIREKIARAEFTAITESAPAPENPRHQFVAGLLAEENIRIVPLNHAEAFAEQLRQRFN
jgi:hypothetical protein